MSREIRGICVPSKRNPSCSVYFHLLVPCISLIHNSHNQRYTSRDSLVSAAVFVTSFHGAGCRRHRPDWEERPPRRWPFRVGRDAALAWCDTVGWWSTRWGWEWQRTESASRLPVLCTRTRRTWTPAPRRPADTSPAISPCRSRPALLTALVSKWSRTFLKHS